MSIYYIHKLTTSLNPHGDSFIMNALLPQFNCRDVTVLATKECKGSGGKTPCNRKLISRWKRASRFIPGEVPSEGWVGLTLELVWIVLRRKVSCLCQERNPKLVHSIAWPPHWSHSPYLQNQINLLGWSLVYITYKKFIRNMLCTVWDKTWGRLNSNGNWH